MDDQNQQPGDSTVPGTNAPVGDQGGIPQAPVQPEPTPDVPTGPAAPTGDAPVVPPAPAGQWTPPAETPAVDPQAPVVPPAEEPVAA